MRNSIGLKILSVALVMAILMAVVAGISSWHLNEVADEATELSHYYMPIEQQAHAAARLLTAEVVHFERHLRLRQTGGPAARIAEEEAAFDKRAADFTRAMEMAAAKVDEGMANESLSMGPRFIQLRSELPQVLRTHADLSSAMRRYMLSGSTEPAVAAAVEESLTRQRRLVLAEISDVTRLVDELARDSAEHALILEDRARLSTWLVTLIAVLLGMLLAWLITRVLVRPVHELVAGTRAVSEGNFDVRIDVKTADEIGALAHSFNDMIGGLKQKELIQSTFGKYVDPRIVKNLIENQGFAQAGEKQRMTVFFSDIAGFTSLCERLTPEELVRFLNHYFTLMSQPIRGEHGIIDKYIGDSIMAFWGPPFIEEADHPLAACRAAVAQIRLMEAFRRDLPGLIGNLPADLRIATRIGISSGEVTVGNIGSDDTRGYTVVGDTVNLASRLESAGKQYGASIIISEDTWKAAHEGLETRELDRIRVVGKNEPVRIFEILALAGEADAARLAWARAYEAALAEFRAGRLAEAHAGFSDCLARNPTDKATRLFIERIGLMQKTGLPDAWDGVWTLTDK